MRGGFAFVKTKWLRERLQETFGLSAHLIPPTVDTLLFKAKSRGNISLPIHLCAMVRVETLRRNPLATLKIVSKVKSRYGSKVRISVFGSARNLVKAFLQQQRYSLRVLNQVNFLGPLDRHAFAELTKRCDVFLDFSSWQAFGRSGLEAMASGCVPILPRTGMLPCFVFRSKNSVQKCVEKVS